MRLLLGVLGAGRVARRRPDPGVLLLDQRLVVELLVGRVAPELVRTRSCSRSAKASASRSASDSSRIAL